MIWLFWLFIGIGLGWLIEFVIDYRFWQRRYRDTNLELLQLQGRIGDLESRALAAEREANSLKTKLADTQNSLERAYADLTGAHTIQATLRKNIQILEDRVDSWGRKIGLLVSAGGQTNSLGAAFSDDDDGEFKSQIEQINAKPDSTSGAYIQSARDPLHLINGIGTVYEQRLNEAGIFTYNSLLEVGVQRIQEIIGSQNWQAIDIADWIAQAKQLLNKEAVK